MRYTTEPYSVPQGSANWAVRDHHGKIVAVLNRIGALNMANQCNKLLDRVNEAEAKKQDAEQQVEQLRAVVDEFTGWTAQGEDFGEGRLAALRVNSMKPEEILMLGPKAREDRARELVCWTARYFGSGANSKWLEEHLAELALLVALGMQDSVNLRDLWVICGHPAPATTTLDKTTQMLQRLVKNSTDAERYRALKKYFKGDHIWYHVFFDEDRKLGSIDAVLDYCVANGKSPQQAYYEEEEKDNG